MLRHIKLILTLILALSLFNTSYAKWDKNNNKILFRSQDETKLTTPELQLFEAIKKYDYKKVKELLYANVSSNIFDEYGVTPLMVAAQRKDVSMAKLLVKNGADVNLRTNRIIIGIMNTASALDYAILTRDTAIVNHFLKMEDVKTYISEHPKHNPIIIACQSDNFKMAKHLIDNGIKISKTDQIALVLPRILYIKNPKTRSNISNVTDNYRLFIRFLMGNPSTITEKDLLRSNIVQSKNEQNSIKEYMQEYNDDYRSEKETKELNEILAEKFASTRRQDYKKELKTEEEEKEKQKAEKAKLSEEIKKAERSQKNRTILFFIIGIILLIYLTYRCIKKNKQTILSSIKHIKVFNFNQKIITKNKRISKNDKGWNKDETKNIKVSLLTIEDMINPIILKNEDEKSVREMIHYIRMLKQHNKQYVGLNRKLNEMWSRIKHQNVRNIYKRSLYLIVEDYQQYDPAVKSFLMKLKKEISKYASTI